MRKKLAVAMSKIKLANAREANEQKKVTQYEQSQAIKKKLELDKLKKKAML